MLTDKNKHSFCPAHWDDIHFSPSQGYHQGCCKSKPIPITDRNTLQTRIEESLSGIRPEGCEYCWKTEDRGFESLRHFKIKKWDGTDQCRLLTLTLGNLCNLQCTYCNEKYSSKWQSDKKRYGQIDLAFDHEVYYGGHECYDVPVSAYINFYNNMQPTEILTVSGGEPLIGNLFYDILEACDLSHLKEIRVSTNLNYPTTKTLDKLLELDGKQQIVFNVSLDTPNSDIQEYIRSGFNWEAFDHNMEYILENTNAKITFNSLMTAHTVQDIYTMHLFVYNLKQKYENRISWYPSYCVQPRIHTFEILNDEERQYAVGQVGRVLQELEVHKELVQVNGVLSYLQSTSFDSELRKDQQRFFKQFNERQSLQTPERLISLIEK